MRQDLAFRLYCTGKVAVAMAMLRLAERTDLDLDSSVGEILEGIQWPEVQQVTWRRVLTHRAGLHKPLASDVVTLDRRRRSLLVRRVGPMRGFASPRIADYSEYSGWHLLGECLEAVSGVPLREVLHDEVLSPLGMVGTWYSMTEQEHARNADSLGVLYDLSGGRPVPMLSDRSFTLCREWNPAYGGYGTAESLARMLVGILAALPGYSGGLLEPPVARSLASDSPGPRFDRTTKQMREFTHGALKVGSQGGFGTRCSDQAFGLAGLYGTSLCVADPAYGIAIAMILNGVVHAREVAAARREALVDAVYEDLRGPQEG